MREQLDSSVSFSEVLASAVDEDFYIFVYGELPPGFTASSHYATVGWRQGHDPNPWFSTQAYLNENPDVLEAGVVPLYHFLEAGAREGRAARTSQHGTAYLTRSFSPTLNETAPKTSERGAEYEHQHSILRSHFDASYYLALNPDVAQLQIDPLTHFIESGWREGRDPNPFFSTKTYLEENSDVANAGVNPFYHYLLAGKAEGRTPKSSLGFRYDVILNLKTPARRMESALTIPDWRLGSKHQLRHALALLTRSQCRRLYVSVSHDNFTENVGGVQLCLRREADSFRARDFDHIHLFPGRMYLVTDHENDDPGTGILVNGELAGHFRASCIAETLEGMVDTKTAWSERSFAIHSLLGHNVKSLARILKSVGLSDGFFWIHDYASVCAGLQLLRNDVEYCDAPEPGSTTCDVCIYGERRDIQLADHEDLFRQFSFTMLAPSQIALDTWKSGTHLDARGGTKVHPHCRLVLRHGPKLVEDGPEGPLRVAYLGLPVVHKGWPVYRELALRFAGDPRFEFFHLGMHREPRLPVRFVEVRVEAASAKAMIEKVEELEIDVAIIWSLWPETFCLAAHEAVAGGAVVVAPSCSGNVAHMVSDSGKGMVLPDETALMELFESSEVRKLARANRQVEFYSLEFSRMTADLVGAQP